MTDILPFWYALSMKYFTEEIKYYDLKKDIEKYSIKAKDVAKITGIDYSHIRAYMNDRWVARFKTFQRIKQAVDMLKIATEKGRDVDKKRDT